MNDPIPVTLRETRIRRRVAQTGRPFVTTVRIVDGGVDDGMHTAAALVRLRDTDRAGRVHRVVAVLAHDRSVALIAAEQIARGRDATQYGVHGLLGSVVSSGTLRVAEWSWRLA